MSKHAEPEAVIKRDWQIEVTLIAKLARRASCVQQRIGRCAMILCEHAWLMACGRLRILTAKATIHELLRSRCKAEQCIRDIEFTVARERAASRKTEQSSVKNMLTEHLVAFKRLPLVDLWLSQYCGLSYGRLPRFKFLVLEGAKPPWQDSIGHQSLRP